MSYRKHTFNEHFFDVIDTEAKAYFLGLLFADGCNSTDRDTVCLALAESDAEIVREFARQVSYASPLKVETRAAREDGWKRQGTVRLVLHSRPLSQRLSNLGCVQRKTHVLRWCPEVPKALTHHFIRGYFDGDGSLYVAKDGRTARGQFGLTITSNYLFCQDLAERFQTHLGISVHLNQHKHRTPIASTTDIILQGAHDKIKTIMRWLYTDATIYLRRKHEKYMELESREKIDNRRPVLQLDKHTKAVLRRFESIQDAARAVGCDSDHIWYVASSRPYHRCGKPYVRHTAKGFVWQYAT